MTSEAINIACAEGMRWTGIHTNDYGVPHSGVSPDGKFTDYILPQFTTDLNAAITLCDKLASEGWGWLIALGEPKGYFVKFTERFKGVEIKQREVAVYNQSLPLAICECFLRANNRWVE